jgi:hypothetical protein
MSARCAYLLVREVFRPGRRLPAADLVRQATGRPLSAAAFVRQFVRTGPTTPAAPVAG